MDNYTSIVTDIEFMQDTDRAKTLEELNAQWCETQGKNLDFIQCALPLHGDPYPLTCRAARLIVRPFPQKHDRDIPKERVGEAEEHISNCDACISGMRLADPTLLL